MSNSDSPGILPINLRGRGRPCISDWDSLTYQTEVGGGGWWRSNAVVLSLTPTASHLGLSHTSDISDISDRSHVPLVLEFLLDIAVEEKSTLATKIYLYFLSGVI